MAANSRDAMMNVRKKGGFWVGEVSKENFLRESETVGAGQEVPDVVKALEQDCIRGHAGIGRRVVGGGSS